LPEDAICDQCNTGSGVSSAEFTPFCIYIALGSIHIYSYHISFCRCVQVVDLVMYSQSVPAIRAVQLLIFCQEFLNHVCITFCATK